jgi:hypothetical protein
MHNKAAVIRRKLDVSRMDPRWSTREMVEHNLLAWMVQDQHGMIYDLRQAPREIQEAAYRQGLIPFVPSENAGDDE